MFVQPEAINYRVKPKDLKALDIGNEKDSGEGKGTNGSLEKFIISCVVNDQPGGYLAPRFSDTLVMLWWLFCKAKATRGDTCTERGHTKTFLFCFERFHQNQTHPSPKGSAKASFTWHMFLIQGPKPLLGSPLLLPPHQCGKEGQMFLEQQVSSSSCIYLGRAVAALLQAESRGWVRFGTRPCTGGFAGPRGKCGCSLVRGRNR